MSSGGRRSNFVRFLLYVKPYWRMVLAASLGGIVKFTVPLLVPQVTRKLIDEVYTNSSLSASERLGQLYYYIGGLIALFVFVWAPWTYVRHYYAGKAGHRVIFDLRCDLFFKIQRMSSSFFDKHQSGGIVSRLISDMALAQNLVGSALTNVWMDAASLVAVLYFMVRMDLMMTGVALITFPFYLYWFRRLGKELRDASLTVQQKIETLSGSVQEKIAGNIVVKAFTRERKEDRVFHHESEDLLSSNMRSVYLQSINITVSNVIVQIAPLIVTLVAGYRVITGSLTVGELIAFGMYLSPLYLPMQRFSELNVVFSNSMAALDRIFEVMDEEPDVRDKEGAVNLTDVKGRVEFVNVSFSYRPGAAVLSDISFTALPGQKIALVGHSGSGKSTIVNLIPRFYDVGSGSVRVDGVDIRDVTLRSLRRSIGIVLQEPVLFSGTIRENILYGDPKATPEMVEEAAKAANALEFITQMPRGFDTEVGERGSRLSGGQKQRITIARAFLKNPRILILDEATSALDSESENLIQDALARLMKDRTTFIIAHRLSTIIDADVILVLEAGRVVESGSHLELLKKNGVYRRLYDEQFGYAMALADQMRKLAL